jgi:hypothetical protein
MEKKIVDFDQLFPGRFLKAGEFEGKEVTLTISAVDLEDLPSDKGGDRKRGVISFAQTPKKLVLNRTNGEAFKAMFGREVQSWVGKRVTLYPAVWNSEGELAVRVKGSPELKEALTYELKLPRKSAVRVTMQPTGKTEAA